MLNKIAGWATKGKRWKDLLEWKETLLAAGPARRGLGL